MPTAAQSKALDRLRATARDLVSLLSAADTKQLQQAPSAGEWPAATVVAHLADAELVYGVRLRMMLTADRPRLVAFDEGAWAARFAELDADVKESLQRWRTQREANLRVFESLDDQEWERVGIHEERGPITVAAVADLLANHDRSHLDQIRHALRT